MLNKLIPCITLGLLTYVCLPLYNAHAQQPSLIEVAQTAQPAVVSVHAATALAEASDPVIAGRNPKTGQILIRRKVKTATLERFGAGVIIHPSGIVVTNAHTVAGANKIAVTLSEGLTFPAKLLKYINSLDIGLLKITGLSGPIQYIPIADSDQIKLGDEVVTVGNSEFLKQTVTGGRIKGLGTNRTLNRIGTQRTDLIQTTINLYKGDSGGPLFNTKAQLIGLMTASEEGTDHSSFAIPSNKIKRYLNQCLLKMGKDPVE